MIEVRTEPLPTTGEFPPLFALLGAHGGAGTTTLATMWAPAADTGQRWPTSPLTTRRVLIVAREHMSGIAAAADVLRATADGSAPLGVTVCGLITVAAHPGRPSKDVLRYAGTVSELAPHSYRIPWVKTLIPLLHRQLPTWRPADGIKTTQTTADGVIATVPSPIAAVGHQICEDLAADRASKLSDPSVTVA